MLWAALLLMLTLYSTPLAKAVKEASRKSPSHVVKTESKQPKPCCSSRKPICLGRLRAAKLRLSELLTRHRSHDAGALCAAWKASGRCGSLGALPGDHDLSAAASAQRVQSTLTYTESLLCSVQCTSMVTQQQRWHCQDCLSRSTGCISVCSNR